MECGCSIDHRKIRAHFLSEHKNVKLPRDVDANFSIMFAKERINLIYPPRPPPHPIPPIYGLRKPIPSYRICNNCKRGFKGRDVDNPSAPVSRAFDTHVCVPGTPNPPSRTYFESHVQAFESSSRSPFFPVLSLTPIVRTRDAWTAYQVLMQSRPSTNQTVSVPDNYRVVEQFLRKEGWIEHVHGLEPAQLKTLIHLTRDDPLLPNLVDHCEAYLHHHQTNLKSYYARRLISTRPSAE